MAYIDQQHSVFTAPDTLHVRSEKLVIVIRFVAGPLLFLGGLSTCIYVLQKSVMPSVIDALNAGAQPHIGFWMFLKGILPLVVALIGLQLIRWESLTVEGDD